MTHHPKLKIQTALNRGNRLHCTSSPEDARQAGIRAARQTIVVDRRYEWRYPENPFARGSIQFHAFNVARYARR